jgi:hypothetical protein
MNDNRTRTILITVLLLSPIIAGLLLNVSIADISTSIQYFLVLYSGLLFVAVIFYAGYFGGPVIRQADVMRVDPVEVKILQDERKTRGIVNNSQLVLLAISVMSFFTAILLI